jgi:phosphate transport system permease protein
MSALVCCLLVLLILGFMIVTGLPLFSQNQAMDLLTGAWSPSNDLYGIAPMILGTLWISLLSVVISFPMSLGCAAYISVLGGYKKATLMGGCVRMMTGIPTIIYGFVGVFLLVPLIRETAGRGSGMCILSASLVLAVLIAPTMILFFIQSFDRVPRSWLDAVDALGGSRVQKLVYVVLPACVKGIVTGTVLSFGRALGDTLVALMIAGNAVQTPNSLLDSARTLTSHIALVSAADFESMEFKSIFLCGAVLYLITGVVILGARLIEKRGNHE